MNNNFIYVFFYCFSNKNTFICDTNLFLIPSKIRFYIWNYICTCNQIFCNKVAVVLFAMVSFNSFAAVKCQPDGRGGMCCWDTQTQGPFRPIGC